METEDWAAPLIKDCLISEIIRQNTPDLQLPELSQPFDVFNNVHIPETTEADLNCEWNNHFYPNHTNVMGIDVPSNAQEHKRDIGALRILPGEAQGTSALPAIPIKQEIVYPHSSLLVKSEDTNRVRSIGRRGLHTFNSVRQRFYVTQRSDKSPTLAIIRRNQISSSSSNSPSPPSSDASNAEIYCHSLANRNRSKMHELALAHNLISEQEPGGFDGRLSLSAEEKRTLSQEGFALPTSLPLSKQEEECLKLVRRKIKNKLSAQESRRKRKEYMETLEEKVQGYHAENTSLRVKLRQLEQSNRSLNAQIAKMKNSATTSVDVAQIETKSETPMKPN